MNKIKLFTFSLILVAIFSVLSGCNYFWPSKSANKVVLPPKVIVAASNYNTEQVQYREVVKSRYILSRFRENNGDIVFSGVPSIETTSFDIGETGKIIIDTSIPYDNNYGKTIEYNAKVISTPTTKSLKTYIIKITDKYDNSIVKNGTLATFKIINNKKENVIAVLNPAIKYYNNETIVGVLVNGVKQDRTVKIGLVGDEYSEILSGLSVGELVIFN